MLSDIAGALELMSKATTGKTTLDLYEHDLAFGWRIAWHDGQIEIESSWTMVPGALQALLNERARVTMSIETFAAEWKMPMRVVLGAFDGAGVEISDRPEPLAQLRALEARIPRYGWLYDRGETRTP